MSTATVTNKSVFFPDVWNETTDKNEEPSVCKDEKEDSDSGSSVSNDGPNYNVNNSAFISDRDKDGGNVFDYSLNADPDSGERETNFMYDE